MAAVDPGGKEIRLDSLEDPSLCGQEAPMRIAQRVLAFKTDNLASCDPGVRVVVFYSVNRDDAGVADKASVRVLAGYCLTQDGSAKFSIGLE